MKHKNILLITSTFHTTIESLEFVFDQLLEENGTVTIFNNVNTAIFDPLSFSSSYFAIIEQVFTDGDSRVRETFSLLHPDFDTNNIKSIIVYGSKE